MTAILPMEPFTNMVMAQIEIWNKKSTNYSKMLITIDTGASVTTISSDILHTLGYNTTNGVTKRITTASGSIYVKSINLTMRIGEIELNDIEVYAHAFPQESFSLGVLGVNVLSLFDVNFAFSKRKIEFYTHNHE